MTEPSKRVFDFGPFRLEEGRRRLFREGAEVPLSTRALDALLVLVQQAGQTVSREELMRAVWNDAIVEDSNLTVTISQIRKALGATDESNEFILTIPRVGYRFIADVRAGAVSTARQGRWTSRLVAGLAAAAVVIAAIAVYVNAPHTGAAPGQPFESLAVLPLERLGSAVEDQSLSLGFADSLIASLGRLRTVRVLSTGAVSRYLDGAPDPIAAGKALGVDAVMTGAVHRVNDRLRVTLRLLLTKDGTQLWTGSVEGHVSRVFTLEDQLARQVEIGLSVDLGLGPVARRTTNNLEAYNLYLQGMYISRRRGLDTQAAPFFAQAIERDPQFAQAWAWLALEQAMRRGMEQAQPTVDRALELDPNLAEGHAVRGFVKFFGARDWAEAARNLDRAIELDPNLVEAHQWRGLLFAVHGDFDRAKAELRRAMELDPTSHNLIGDLGQVFFYAKEYDKAEQLFLKADSLFRGSHATLFKQMQAAREGLTREAAEAEVRSARRDIAAANPPTGDAVAYLWSAAAIGYMHLGEKTKACDGLNKVLETRAPYGSFTFELPFLGVDPRFNLLHDEPCFSDVLKKLNLLDN